MAGRNFHLSNGSLFFTWLIAGILFLILPQTLTSRINFLFQKTFSPLLQLGRQVQLHTFSADTGNQEAVSKAEYDNLRKKYQNMHAQLMQLHQDYETLSQIRSGLPQPFSKLILARVANRVGGFSHEIIINKGHDAGLTKGQYVLSAGHNSIVGVVSDTAESLARVRLLTDSSQSIEIRIRREGTTMDIDWLMTGDGKDGCKISRIPKKNDIRVGDTVFAAARPGFLNVPVIIGEVVDVRPDEQHPLLWDIRVEPVENMKELDDIAVIVTEEL
ncbi:MAG: rod shape-determining protein MreC [Planctomycetes bacterium]|nr:rod shape-determining protein MreC [Planctomycetota bacterium]